jgi:hypothetical protein
MVAKFKECVKDPNYKKNVDKDQLSQMIIHLADLSSPTKEWEISKFWSIRINNEFIQ